jgi:hypothetical protein
MSKSKLELNYYNNPSKRKALETNKQVLSKTGSIVDEFLSTIRTFYVFVKDNYGIRGTFN